MRLNAFALSALVLAACARAGGGGPAPADPPAAVPAPPPDVREQTADQQIRHALSRLAFGPRPGDVARVRTMGVDRWIALQLEPARIADDSVERLLAGFETLRMTSGELTDRYPAPAMIRARQRRRQDTVVTREDSVAYREAVRASQRIVAELAAARVLRASLSERQLQEVMVDFWHNHFSVFLGKGAPMRYFLVEYDRDVIRPHALGRFRDLLGAVARSEAMLFYLDNWQSAADSGRRTLAGDAGLRRGRGRRGARMTPAPTPAPLPAAPRRRGLNENYARELLELHTLGVDGGYTQTDVIEVARAFTGWSIEDPRRGGGFTFRPAMHDADAKRVLDMDLPAGRGMEDGDRVLDLLARHPSTARYIATKLARRLLSDAPPPSLVDRAAAAFTRTDGDIREVVRTIVASPEFWSAEAYRAKVKSPFELVVSAARALNAGPDLTPRTAQIIGRLGQAPWGHQAPNGWPETGDAWINTGSILNRINFGMAAAAGALPGARPARWPLADSLARASHEAQVDAVIAALLGGEASSDTRAVLRRGENPLAASLAARDSANPSAADTSAAMADEDPMLSGEPMEPGAGRRGRRGGMFADRPGRLPGLAQLVGLALGSPEFQRR